MSQLLEWYEYSCIHYYYSNHYLSNTITIFFIGCSEGPITVQCNAVQKGVILVSEAQKGFSGVGKQGKELATQISNNQLWLLKPWTRREYVVAVLSYFFFLFLNTMLTYAFYFRSVHLDCLEHDHYTFSKTQALPCILNIQYWNNFSSCLPCLIADT